MDDRTEVLDTSGLDTHALDELTDRATGEVLQLQQALLSDLRRTVQAYSAIMSQPGNGNGGWTADQNTVLDQLGHREARLRSALHSLQSTARALQLHGA